MTSQSAATPSITRWCCVCAYDGTPFAGWQSQPGGVSLQDAIEVRLKGVFGKLIRVHASGRTDAGVHARGQVFHFDAAWRHGADKLLKALRVNLPTAIQLRSMERVGEGFHSRFSASGKRYRYELDCGDADPFSRPFVWAYGRPLDLRAMRQAAAALQGRHDFRAFSAINGPEKEDTVRTLRRLKLISRGTRLSIVAEADGFMYKMVRTLVGALVVVGEGKLTPEAVSELLTTRKRLPAVFTAPPQGLFLEKVYYPRGAKKKRAGKGAFSKGDSELCD